MGEVERSVEDRLREEYFTLLPEIRRVADQLEAEVKYHIRFIAARLRRHERLAVKFRVKSCESALEKLRAQQEGAAFDESLPAIYSLTGLNDLAGSDILAFKYHGKRRKSDRIKGEYQVVSMLTGLFWEVEHSAIYKPDIELRGIDQNFGMRERTRDVAKALRAFEEYFEALSRQR